ncbi:cilia- and flagella-associated protein 47-like [Brachyistius frenatus]|uniref:cilia- and flagella-associated protein 47-like n=1 Tax=Brachyistius frenatus TaxID=100188 RepID=UPI0037E7883D
MAGSCVRVDPPCVEFREVTVGRVYKMPVTATNVGKTLKRIFIEKPASKLFKFTASSPGVEVAPGLSAGGLLEFTPKEEGETRGCLLIHIDDVEIIKIPLLGFPRACSLVTDSVLDFGCVMASSEVISKRHPVINKGSVAGMFQVQYRGDTSVSLSPSSGVVAAGTTQWLKVELRTDRPRLIDEKVMVKVQNSSSVVFRIRAKVVDERLELFDPQGTPLSCLRFGPIYFRTSCVKNVVLRNNSPRQCDWVCLLQDTAAGTEVGTDLQRSTDAALVARMQMCSPATQDVSQVLVCVPKQGRLGPYDKTTLAVRFSPVCRSVTGAKKRNSPAGRQDYCLFLLFESVGSKHGFTHQNGRGGVELAVTGSGLPVSLALSPSCRFDFLSCATGQRVDLLCVLQNLCAQLPVSFRFRRVPHFAAEPAAGTVGPGQCQDVILCFNARQHGSFEAHQKLDVLGHVVCQRDSAELKLCSVHTVTLHLSAVCHSETTHPVPKLNLSLGNPIGPRPHVRRGDLARCGGMFRAAVLSADRTRLHEHRREGGPSAEAEELLAFPNDRASSLRPDPSHLKYRTIFTGVPRYNYVDTRYAFTEEEEEQRRRHRQIYADYIKQLGRTQTERDEEREEEEGEDDDVDIGIVPAHGLVPPTLLLSDIKNSSAPDGEPNHTHGSPGNSRPLDTTSITQVSEGMNGVPTTSQEVADCDKSLTAEELYQVVIGPSLVDFGSVCAQSANVRRLELTNQLPAYVWVQLEVDCPELQGSSPLSHVLPPRCRATLPLTFQSSKMGPFYRAVSYSVNKRHPGQIVVQARVIPPALELSTTRLVLRPNPTLLAAYGLRSSVTLRNRRNHAAEFMWRPVVTETGILFSIRPATGVVEPFKELDCEVVWHPSFSSPSEGDFDLYVHKGNTQRLHCVAKVGATSVTLAEKRLLFGSVPLNMPSVRTAVLHNAGQNHAYYRVLDVRPLPGMVVSPSEGVVPSRGRAALEIRFDPDAVFKFDTAVEVALRNTRSVELRVSGSVEPPDVDISVTWFRFRGVHVGSRRAIPFALANRTPVAARVTFDLSEHEDFSLRLPRPSAESVVEVKGRQTVNCSLVFSPTEVCGYDFDLPMTLNGVKWTSAAPSSSTSSWLPADGRKHAIQLLSCSVATATQPRVQATVLRAPLEMSPRSLRFHVEPQSDTLTKKVELKAACEASACWCHVAGRRVRWWFGLGAPGEPCAVSPSSGSLGPGESVCLAVGLRPDALGAVSGRVAELSLPLYLGGEEEEEEGVPWPYRELSITVALQSPAITVHPPQILLAPVPLESNAVTTITLVAVGYPSGTRISAEVDEVETKEGTKIQPVSVTFPDGNAIPAREDRGQEAGVASLPCSVSFRSSVPLSVCTTVTFADHLLNRFKVKLCAVADNCLLTAWPYVAAHHPEQRIVLRMGATAVEAILQRYHTPSPASFRTSSSLSSFDHNSSTNKNSDFSPDSDSASRRTCGDASPDGEAPSVLGLPEFPAADTEEGLFHQNVLLAAERWFSLFGWSGGPHPVTVPHTLRRVVSKIETDASSGCTSRVTQNKDSRSVSDMLRHLTGGQIPGIPRCQTFSGDVGRRVDQLLRQHGAILAFLRVQGACLCHIRPEYLLDAPEFKHWCSLQVSSQVKDAERGPDLGGVDYESLSKRCWTDVLLQTYKVLVLRRVAERGPGAVSNPEDAGGAPPVGTPTVGSQPLASNVYSSWELRLLSWLNRHYEAMRTTVWGEGSSSGSGVPSARWIVNFDLDLTDGLVLAALLSAYCPFLIPSHFRRMYAAVSSLEQILHNNIIVAAALNVLHLNVDMQPTDLSDPNPVQMLTQCVHLYERLPHYLPTHTVTLSGSLHGTFSKQVCLRSPSSAAITYQGLVLGEDAHLFSLPGGSTVTVPPKSSAELSVRFRCAFLRPAEAVLLLVSASASGPRCSALAVALKAHVSRVAPTDTVEVETPCYQLRAVQVPLVNTFGKEATFRVVLVESTFNPLDPETKKDGLVRRSLSKANVKTTTSDEISREEIEDGEGGDFLSATRTVRLKPGRADVLSVRYLPFCPGTKYCLVLLVCPQVGDMVYLVKATAKLPLPSPLLVRPSSNVSVPKSSGACVAVLRLRCEVGKACEGALGVPRVNAAWERALAARGRHGMGAEERRRRKLTGTLHSSVVRAAAARKLTLPRGVSPSEEVEYAVEVSSPQQFTLPGTVTIPVREDGGAVWGDPADGDCVDVPFQFQADSAGHFACQVVLRSWCDTRVFLLEALVYSQQGGSFHLDFTSPARRPVTQHLPLYNETHLAWKMRADICAEGFSGPEVLNVPSGTRVDYPLTFHPAAQCVVTGKLSLRNESDGTEHVFTLRGVGEHPLPVDHVVLHCPVGRTTHTQLDVPNYSQDKHTLTVATDLSVASGTSSLEIQPGRSAPYALSVSPWKRGKQTGCVSFTETDEAQEAAQGEGNVPGRYEVHFSLELICEPAAPVEVINAQCAARRSVAIEIPVNNPRGEPLTLDVQLEGGDLSGAGRFSVPPRGTLAYEATFSPVRVGKTTGSVIFQSDPVGEFWYQLELYALPPPVDTLPQACCQLGQWTRLTVPLVNSTAEPLEVTVTNSNPRNYTLEMDSESPLIVEPRSSSQLGVRFRPSAIGEGNHKATITFTCPQRRGWCVRLSGRGLMPETQEPLRVSCAVGSEASVAVAFTNPTELAAALSVTLADEDPGGAAGEEVFSVPLGRTEGIQIGGRATLHVPVVFAPKSAGLRRARLRIALEPRGVPGDDGHSGPDGVRSETEPATICWVYPLRGNPLEAPAEDRPLGVLQCEAGCRLEKELDVLLAGYAPGNEDRRGREVAWAMTTTTMDDFLCEVQSVGEAAERSEVEDRLAVSVRAARKEPEDAGVTLTLNLVYTPVRTCRCSGVVAVRSASGNTWEFPIALVATEPRVDDVIVMETTKAGETSAVGFRLISTTRRPEPFSAAFLPGSSGEFAVTPASGTLPPVGCVGVLITVSFTPDAGHEMRSAILAVQAADMRWTYEVRGKARPTSPPPSDTEGNSSAPGPSAGRRQNFVVRNLRVPSLANSSPLKVRR